MLPKNPQTLRILHTSDWHIGKRLYHQNRYAEFAQFLQWLYETICTQAVDVLIVAGDIFDTMTPSNKAQELYYDFLAKIAKSPCQHVIIIAGNHDSPTLIDAPKTILKNLSIHIIGVASNHPKNDCLLLSDPEGLPQAIILTVPYLRDKDIKKSTSLKDASTDNTLLGIKNHYHTLSMHAQALQKDLTATTGKTVPIIATGHLFCAGAKVLSNDDGMRQIYVGTLGQIPATIFEPCMDYVALGHIHAPQKVGGFEHIRYCGSPLALGFGEIGNPKQVLIVDFDDKKPTIHALDVPIFQELCHIAGDLTQIFAKLDELIATHRSIWVEIIYTGNTIEPNLRQKIIEYLAETQVLAIHIKNKRLYESSLHTPIIKKLDTLSPMDVFNHRLDKENLNDDERFALQNAYQTLLKTLHDAE